MTEKIYPNRTCPLCGLEYRVLTPNQHTKQVYFGRKCQGKAKRKEKQK